MEDSLLVFNNMAVHNNHQFVYDDVSGVFSTLQQTFHISPTETFTSAFKFPVDMAATLGFPFTEAQWRELKRQAMIYKYMMASLPVPLHLLISADSAAFYSPSSFRGVNLRLGTNGIDQEPGRCRRTDGKKWRCSRDAAPDQKYCERHMHRGRPRSRKPVEQLHATNTINTSHTNKKTRRDLFVSVDSPATLPVSDVSVNKNGPLPLLFNQSDYKVANADVNVNCTVPAYKEIRSLECMKMKGETFSISTSEQPHSRHTDVGLATDSRFNSFHVLDQHHYPDQPLNLSLFGNVGAGQYQQGNKGTMFMNDSLPHTNQVDDEMGRVQISLGTIESEENQEHINVTSFSMAAATTPGGPLAEVLHSGAITAQSASAAAFAYSPTTTATSPDGIVQTSRVLFSESSDKSSLTLVAI